MKRTFTVHTATGKAFVFELWKRGTGFSEIATTHGFETRYNYYHVEGRRGHKPNGRRRAVAHLTICAREEISADLSARIDYPINCARP